jgi:hypothetical protein
MFADAIPFIVQYLSELAQELHHRYPEHRHSTYIPLSEVITYSCG